VLSPFVFESLLLARLGGSEGASARSGVSPVLPRYEVSAGLFLVEFAAALVFEGAFFLPPLCGMMEGRENFSLFSPFRYAGSLVLAGVDLGAGDTQPFNINITYSLSNYFEICIWPNCPKIQITGMSA
jgi:hypothetical protein